MSEQAVSNASSLWPLEEVLVGSLFGTTDFKLALNELAVVLTGENGSGKSTLLRAIDFVGKQEWQEFALLPLERLELVFRSGPRLAIRKTDAGLRFSSGEKVWNFNAEAAAEFDPHTFHTIRWPSQPPAQQMRLRNIVFHRTAEVEEVEELVQPEWLTDLAERFHTKMISARRLEHRLRPDANTEEERPLPVVE